jgi:4-diphosphocytidyl-2-C-methyl-D-erythritol kinase
VTSRRTVVRAPAKLTISLRVVGVRADGYHLLDAEMVTLALADVLTFDERAAPAGGGRPSRLTVAGPHAAGVPTDGSNLIQRALAATGCEADVHVDKQIPAGGGLGGGSADAAAVLRWAGVTDLEVAAKLGADVPFCLVGGRARVTGVGEVIEPLGPIDRTFTLVTPPLTVATPAVYRAWDELGGPRSDGPNDLEAPALVVEPRLEDWKQRIAEALGDGATPILAGSGATWFVDGARPDLAAALPEANVVVTRTDRP